MMSASVVDLAREYGVLTRRMASGLLGITEPHASRLFRRAVRQGKLTAHRLRLRPRGRPEEAYTSRHSGRARCNVLHTFQIAKILMAIQAALPEGFELLFARCFSLGELTPDASVIIQRDKGRAGFCLEVDTGSESLSSSMNSTRTLVKKIEAYARHFRQEAAATVSNWFGLTPPLRGLRILLVLPGWTRARHLRQLVGNQGSELDFVWLTTFADIEGKQQNVLTDPIWELLGSGTRRALISGRGGASGQALSAQATSERR